MRRAVPPTSDAAPAPPTSDAAHAPPRPLAVRLLWFVGLWAASVAVVGAVAYGIRIWIV